MTPEQQGRRARTVDKKRRAILEWLKLYQRIDVCTTDAVDFFVKRTGATYYLMTLGASRCPLLSRTLGQMYQDNILNRHASGLEGFAGMGFPRWVYVYELTGYGKYLLTTLE